MKIASSIRAVAVTIGVAGAGLVGCGQGTSKVGDAVEGRPNAFTLTVDRGTLPIDMLWVVDNSASMCDEQRSLAESFAAFEHRVSSFFTLDPHVAVTTQDVRCDIDGVRVVASKGVFNTVPATVSPPPCQERRVRSCLSDDACANMDCVVRGQCALDDPSCSCDGALGEWACAGPSTESCLTNPNGSVNSWCRRRCTTDADCQALFGDPAYVCQQPSANAADWGCVLPPATSACPATVPPILDASDSDLFPCVAAVGVNQERCFRYDEGMNAALLALDRTGPNAEQAAAFLRDGALLVLVFVADEDDCSVAAGQYVDGADRITCASLPTTDDGGPLQPVSYFAERFMGLVHDPSKVIVAAIDGDSTATDPAQVAADRAAFAASKFGGGEACHQQTSICSSDQGAADFGARYLALTESFGTNGLYLNICEDAGLGPALEAVADRVVAFAGAASQQVCLPNPVADPSGLVVTRTVGGDPTAVPLGSAGYVIVPNAEGCAVGGEPRPALVFADGPAPGEVVTVTYAGDPT